MKPNLFNILTFVVLLIGNLGIARATEMPASLKAAQISLLRNVFTRHGLSAEGLQVRYANPFYDDTIEIFAQLGRKSAMPGGNVKDYDGHRMLKISIPQAGGNFLVTCSASIRFKRGLVAPHDFETKNCRVEPSSEIAHWLRVEKIYDAHPDWNVIRDCKDLAPGATDRGVDDVNCRIVGIEPKTNSIAKRYEIRISSF